MNRIDKNMIDEKDIDNLRNCISYDEVEEFFDTRHVSSIGKKLKYLRQAMGNPDTMYSSQELTLDDKLDLEIAMFLSRAWAWSLTFPSRAASDSCRT